MSRNEEMGNRIVTSDWTIVFLDAFSYWEREIGIVVKVIYRPMRSSSAFEVDPISLKM